MPAFRPSYSPRLKRFFTSRPPVKHRGTLRDLYVSGLVSVFRRDSILRIWEPLRETRSRTNEG
jgi:hypothetical protein